MNQLIKKYMLTAVTALATYFHCISATAGPLDGVMAGMLHNLTPPSVIDNQFSGGLSAGGAYIRMPISSAQLIAIDPPRLSAGCGGIDAYFGAYTHISAEKLIQFMRHMAQNAASLAFQLALESASPQLSGMLKAFNDFAQKVNATNKNSCELAKGILSFDNKDMDIGQRWSASKVQVERALEGATDDLSKAMTEFALAAGTETKAVSIKTDISGKALVPDLRNTTWEAIKNRKLDGYIFNSVADTDQTSREIVMSILGTQTLDNRSATAQPTPKIYLAKIQLSDLVEPKTFADGKRGISILKCIAPIDACEQIDQTAFLEHSGLKGVINLQMVGNEAGTLPASATSIVGKMKNCTQNRCDLDAPQQRFLNSIGNIPAVGFLKRIQKLGDDSLIPDIVGLMVSQVAVVYGDALYNLAADMYSGTDVPKPSDYTAVMANLKWDIAEYKRLNSQSNEKIANISQLIDYKRKSQSRMFQRR